MTSTPEASNNSDKHRAWQKVVDYYLEQRASNPNFMIELDERLQKEWDSLPPAEHDAIAMAQQLYNREDLAERGRSTAALLFARFINGEVEATEAMERLFPEIPPAGDIETVV